MRIFLTGASGYLGQHVLVRLLDAGHDVTALVRSPDRLGGLADATGVTVSVADLHGPDVATAVERAVAGHDACVHAAFVWGAPEQDLDLLDARAAARLFDAAGRAGVARSVLVSSTAVHRPFTGTMRESDALAPTDAYGATKVATESFLWSACAAHGMAGVVLRPGPIVGPPAVAGGPHRSDRRIAALVSAARRGDPLDVARDDARQFVAAVDVARALVTAATSPEAAGTYLCVDRLPTTWESIARRAVAATGSSSAVRVAPPSESAPLPRFDDTRLAELLRGPLDSGTAMDAHIACLVAEA